LLIKFVILCVLCYEDDDPQTVKTRLRQWAQVVACAVRQSWMIMHDGNDDEHEWVIIDD